MGLMRFLVQDRQSLAPQALARIYMSGMEELPWRSEATWDGDVLVVERDEDDSGNVHVPWLHARYGEQVLSTACLIEREKPYLLEVELARGALNTLRNQVAAWQQVGLILPDSIEQQMAAACRRFAHAATSQAQPAAAAEHARAALDLTFDLGRQLGVTYTQQALGARRQNGAKLTTLLGVNLGVQPLEPKIAQALVGTFNTAIVPIGWRQLEIGEGRRDWSTIDRQIEWCQKNGLKVCAGPLLPMDSTGIPDWTYLWEGDFDNLLSFMLEHVRTVVNRCRGKVQLWQVASRVNCGRALSLTEEQRLRIVVRAIESVREIDPRTPLVVSFDQPWGEYLAHQDFDLAPIHFADALARSELGLSGFALEINTGYAPGGTQPHGLIEYSQHLDRWSQLGLPLMLTLAAPSSSAADPKSPLRLQPTQRGLDLPHTRESQAEWIADFLPLMLSKNCVQVICWNQLRDSVTHDFPHGGLFDEHDHPKPALAALKALRQNYLN